MSATKRCVKKPSLSKLMKGKASWSMRNKKGQEQGRNSPLVKTDEGTADEARFNQLNLVKIDKDVQKQCP